MPGLRRPAGGVLADVAVVTAWFTLAGVVAAVVWWQLTPLAEYTRTTENGSMGEEQLGRLVSADGWFAVVAAAGGLLSGVVLLAWRRRDPLIMVVLVAAGGGLATWLMAALGTWLGPPDPNDVLPGLAVGETAPVRLVVHASGLYFVWPITALLGAIGVIWGTSDHVEIYTSDGRPRSEQGAGGVRG